MGPITHPRPPFTVDRLPYEQVPRSSRIFLDYIAQKSSLLRFYAGDWRHRDTRQSFYDRLRARSYPREALAEILTRQNRALNADDAVMRNIERLAQEGTVAVVSGQQAGLFTGPIYTVTKALCAAKWAARLNEEGIPAVPVFWAEVEDHDLDEVDHIGLADRNGQWLEIKYRPQEASEGQPVGRLTLDTGIGEAIALLAGALPDSEFIGEVRADLESSYSSGRSWADAFGLLLMKLTAGSGLIWIDPSDSAFKPLLSPLYLRVLDDARNLAAALVARSGELLEAGYHNQIHTTPEMVPLFVLEGGRRKTLSQNDGQFQSRDGERKWSLEQLRDLAIRGPESFSQAAALRPIAQDTLLPTLMYVGGPSEIAYFAQLQPLYQSLDRPPPLLAPRASITVVEPRHARTLERYRIRVQDLFRGIDEVIRMVAERNAGEELLESFSETERLIRERLAAIEHQLAQADPTLVAAAETAAAKMLYQVSNLRAKFVNAQAHRDESMEQQLRRACTVLAPERRLQERQLNVYYFQARYGTDFLRWLYQGMDLDETAHQVLTLQP